MIKKFVLVFITLLIALLLALFPLPPALLWLRPAWVVMILVYWAFVLPNQFNLLAAWCMGILLDGLNGGLLGEHALALVLVTYMALYLNRQLRFYSLVVQMLYICFFVAIYQCILFLIEGISGHVINDWQFWIVPFISMLYWPFVYIVLQSYRHRYQIK